MGGGGSGLVGRAQSTRAPGTHGTLLVRRACGVFSRPSPARAPFPIATAAENCLPCVAEEGGNAVGLKRRLGARWRGQRRARRSRQFSTSSDLVRPPWAPPTLAPGTDPPIQSSYTIFFLTPRLVDALTAIDPAAAAALPTHPPATTVVFAAASRAAWDALVASRVSQADADEDDDDPLASHVARALDHAALTVGGRVIWRPSAAPGAPAPLAAAAATAAGWAPGAGAVPRVSPRFGPWCEPAGLILLPSAWPLPRPLPRRSSLTQAGACYASLAAAAATAAAGTPAEWRAAAEARDAAAPGHPWRYGDTMLRYLHASTAGDRRAALAAAVQRAAAAAAAAAATSATRPGTPPRASPRAVGRGSSPESQ